MFPPSNPYLMISLGPRALGVLAEASQTPSPAAAKASSPPGPKGDTNKVDSEVYIADGDYIKDIEVNDLRNRYTLTKSSTQKMVNNLSYPLIVSGISLFQHLPRLPGLAIVSSQGAACFGESGSLHD